MSANGADGRDPQGPVDRDAPTRPARTGRGPGRTSTWRRSTPAWSTPAATSRGCSPARASSWLGPQVWRSDDLGETWQETPNGAVRFPEDTDATVARVWQLTPGAEDDVVYAGTEPGAVCRSTDRGETFTLERALWDHPHRPEWGAGFGGQAFHTILPAPRPTRDSVTVGHLDRRRLPDHRRRRARGTPRNQGIRAEFLPEGQQYPEFGQCVHKVTRHPSRPERLYLQNHGGVYRSDDERRHLEVHRRRAAGRVRLPDRGAPARARHGLRLPDQRRRPAATRRTAKARVWRSRDAGETWEELGEGLPDDFFVARDARRDVRRRPRPGRASTSAPATARVWALGRRGRDLARRSSPTCPTCWWCGRPPSD